MAQYSIIHNRIQCSLTCRRFIGNGQNKHLLSSLNSLMIILGYLSLPFRQIKRFLAKVGTYTVISGILLLAQFPFILYISHNPTSYITFFRHKYSFLSTCIEFYFVFYSLHLFLGFRNELSIFVMRFLIDLQPNL